MTANELSRFIDKIEFQKNDCILWIGCKTPDGYGMMRLDQTGKMKPAHRLAYEHFVAKIPQGKQIDHKCRNRSCVNFTHLEPVTQRENLMRGIGNAAVNEKKTHCIRGHAFADHGAIYPNTHGKMWRRTCKLCKNAAERIARARRLNLSKEASRDTDTR